MPAELKVGGADIELITATIASGQTVGSAVDLGTKRLFAIVTPAALTSTAMTFQASHDGTTYNAVYDDAGTQLSYTVAASRYIAITSPAKWIGVRYLKLVGGSAEGGTRSIVLVTVP
jgi:hypothetical protein